MTHFINLSGKAQNGKDTAAAMIKDKLQAKGKTAIIVHYADLLKYICKTFFGWNGEKDECGRSLLQRVGTDCVRKKNPDFWVDFIISIASMFPDDWEYVIVPDTRFPNEIGRVAAAGFPITHIRVVRENFNSPLTGEQQNHPSETALDNVTPDYLLYNKTLKQLEESVQKLCDEIIDNASHEPVQLSIFDMPPYAEGA